MFIADIVLLVWVHFVADFLLQSDKMALNKSKSNKWLAAHCLVYSIPLIFIGPLFALVNGLSHFVIDYTTSRINSKLWKQEKRGAFFNMIGCDQAIHMTVLFVSYFYLGCK